MSGNLILIGTDPSVVYTAGLSKREMGFKAAQPMLRAMAMLGDAPTAQAAYTVPCPVIAIAKDVVFKDGDRPGAKQLQGYNLSGTCFKRGVEGLRISEGDRLAAAVNNDMNRVMDNLEAHGRAERLLEDRQGTKALEAGETLAQATIDKKAFFSTQHLINPAGPDVAANHQSNRLNLPISASNIFKAIQAMLKWKAENNADPIYQGFKPRFKLMVPNDLAEDAHKALREIVPESNAAVENITAYYLSQADLFINSYLTDATAWYLGVINAGAPLVTRVTFRDRQRWDKGLDSALYQETKQIEYFSDEWTDYRLTDYRCWLKSKP